MVSCFDVADYFIWLSQETGSFISNLQLQKLVYYAQAWYLGVYGEPLFQDDFEAWVHGPVIPVLYRAFKDFGWRPIEVADRSLEGLPENVFQHLDDVAEEYFGCSGFELERMTHAEDPWIRARGGAAPDELSSNIIQKSWIKEYFSTRVQEQ